MTDTLHTRQPKRTMSFRIKLDTLTPEVLAALFSPAALLSMRFRELYGQHWYLGGDT